MNNQIKARGRLTNSKRWVEGYYCTAPLTDENSGLPPSSGWFFLHGETRHLIIKDNVAFTVDPETVGYGPGRKYSNGENIFCGDIVQSTYTKDIGIIKYGEFRDESILDLDQDFYIDDDKDIRQSYGFYVHFNDDQETAIDNMPGKWLKKIGNVHDNPDWFEVQHE